MPTDGIRLPIVRSGNVGASPLFGQLLGKQSGSTLLRPYMALGSLSMNMCDNLPIEGTGAISAFSPHCSTASEKPVGRADEAVRGHRFSGASDPSRKSIKVACRVAEG